MNHPQNSHVPPSDSPLARSRSRYRRNRPAIPESQFTATSKNHGPVPISDLSPQTSTLYSSDDDARCKQDVGTSGKTTVGKRRLIVQNARQAASVPTSQSWQGEARTAWRQHHQANTGHHGEDKKSKGNGSKSARKQSFGPSPRLKTDSQCAAPPFPTQRLGKANLSPQQAQDYPSQRNRRSSSEKPAFDAPISAVNAGQRRVTVEYDKSVISVVVTPSTTPRDVVQEACLQLKIPLEVEGRVVLESFRQLGLERPLRWYEHIRDVLNSWDNDSQNALIVSPCASNGHDGELEAKSVHTQRPESFSAQMYHSQRPRHWGKQLFTLRPDGQIVSARKDGTNSLCHLSDFDIYTPTKRQLSKKIKPPKKFCFAIKSQQKSSMFLSTENFVHFFSTNDKDLAPRWYAAVQNWRSWYLVNVLGEGRVAKADFEKAHSAVDARSNERQASIQLPEAIASEDPIRLKTNRLPFSKVDCRQVKTTSFLEKSTRPDSTKMDSLGNGATRRSSTEDSPQPFPSRQEETRTSRDPFDSNGLLGRTYTQRKKVQEARGQAVGGPIFHSNRAIDAEREAVSAQKTAPLVDLTPQYQEPPQHRKGRGIVPTHAPVGGLVEVATSPEQAVRIPPAATWKRAGESTAAPARSGTVRSRQNKKLQYMQTGRQQSSSPARAGFSDGLLATEMRSQGDSGHGRGVENGKRDATSPLMDLSEGSKYVPGSLLASVERQQGGISRSVIDRERKKEVNIDVGELR